jgi:outer membrane protein assembly factor BamB
MTTISETFPEAKEPSPEPAAPPLKKLRVWPAAAILGLLWITRAAPLVFPDAGSVIFMIIALGPMVAALAITLWWLTYSRAAWSERLLGLAGMIAVAAVGVLLADESMRSFIVIVMFVLPWGLTAFAGTLVPLYAVRSRWRTAVAVLAAAIGFGVWTVARYEGMRGDFKSDMTWRWTATPEDRYLADLSSQPDQASSDRAVEEPLAAPEWPGFRGPSRDAVAPGVELETDWQAHPPKLIWQRLIGPGWSSFAVAGRRLYTQEQRGDEEAVLCLDAETGAERWVRTYPSRFFESMGGVGPRATPTLADSRLFTLGAQGVLLCLDPVTGEVLWKRELKTDAGRDPPIWGFSSSSLVVGDVVVVHGGGEGDKGLLAYDVATGEVRWSIPAGDHTYGSPHLAHIAGKPIVLMHSNFGLHAVDPEEGKSLGTADAKVQNYTALQPLSIDEDHVLLALGMDDGARRFEVSLDGGAFKSEEEWTTRDMKSGFNDSVAHQGYLYGFDKDIFACIDVETGKRQWKKGRYGAGQVLLLPDADQLLVLSESGEVVLLRATPEKLDELARYQAIEGKTWNHPALAAPRLYVRNGEQAACLELPLRGSGSE